MDVLSNPLFTARELPQAIVSLNSSGWLQAHVDGVALKFDSDDDSDLVLVAEAVDTGAVTITLQGGVDGSSWTSIKSGSATFSIGPD